MDIRRLLTIKEIIQAEGGLPAIAPVTRVAACAVIENPLAGQASDDLGALIPLGADLGERLVRECLAQLSRAPIAYGKAAIIGLDGDIEHGAAILHPRMGKPWTDARDTPLLEPPGFLLSNYGRATLVWTFALHLAYGAIVGTFAALS